MSSGLAHWGQPTSAADYTRRPGSEDQPALHETDRQAPRQEREPDQEREVPEVLPALEAEDCVPDELDAMKQRIDVAEHLRPRGQLVEREEGAGDEEHRREQP